MLRKLLDETFRATLVAVKKIIQRTFHNLPLFAGGFFVLIILVVLIAKIGYFFLAPKIIDAAPTSLVIGKDEETRSILENRFKHFPGSNFELNNIFSIFPKEITLTVLNEPIDFGLIAHANYEQLSKLAVRRIQKNIYVRPLGSGFVTISSSPLFYEIVYKDQKTIPLWNFIEIKSLLGQYGGIIRQNISPSEFGVLTERNSYLLFDLSRMLYTNLNLVRALPNILNSEMITTTPSKMPDGSILRELRLNRINLNLNNSEENDLYFNEEESNKICFQTNFVICF